MFEDSDGDLRVAIGYVPDAVVATTEQVGFRSGVGVVNHQGPILVIQLHCHQWNR